MQLHAQNNPAVEEAIQKASFGLKRAMMIAKAGQDPGDFTAHIDTLEKYLYLQPVQTSLVMKYLGTITLNAYYVVMQKPGIDYNEIEQTVTRAIDLLLDPSYIICAIALGDYLQPTNPDKALEFYNMALHAAKTYYKEEAYFDEYNIRKKITMLHFINQQMPQFVEAQEHIIPIIKKVAGEKFKAQYINELNLLAMGYNHTSRYAQADSCYAICQEFYETSPLRDPDILYQLLLSRAEVKKSLSQYHEAIAIYQKMLRTQQPGTPQYAEILLQTAITYRETGDVPNSKEYANQCLASARKDPEANFETLYQLIALFKNIDGINKSKEIAAILKFNPQSNDLVTLSRLASIQAISGNYDLAHNYTQQAKQYADNHIKAGKVDFQFGTQLGELANALQALGQYRQAIHYSQIALNSVVNYLGAENNISIQSMSVLASLHMFAGNNEEAIEILHEASRLASASPENAFDIDLKIAEWHFTTGNFEEAIRLNEKLLKQYPQSDPLTQYNLYSTLAGCHSSLADLLNAEGDKEQSAIHTEKACDNALEALRICTASPGKNTLQHIMSLNQLAGLYSFTGDIKTAGQYAKDCLNAINKWQADPTLKALQKGAVAAVYIQMKEYDKAIPLIEDEIKTMQHAEGENFTSNEISWYIMAEAQAGKKQYPAAQSSYHTLYHRLTTQVKNNFAFMDEPARENYWRQYRDQLFNAGKYAGKYAGTAYSQTMYNAALFSKGILLNSTIALTELIRQQGDKSLSDDFDRMRYNLSAAYSKETNLTSTEKEQLIREAAQLKKSIGERLPAYRDYIKFLETDWQAVRDALQPGETAIEFIEYQIAKDTIQYAALIISNSWESPRAITLFTANQLLTTPVGSTTVQKALQSYHDQENFSVNIGQLYAPRNTTLYQLIWQPLEQHLTPGSHIYFSPAGLLHLISIEHLADNGHTGTYIHNKYHLHRCSSTREVLSRNRKHTFTPGDSAVLYGGIQYNAGTKPLPHSQKEVEIIKNTLAARNITAQTLQGSDAGKESFKALSGHSPAIIHLSTHGISLSGRGNTLKSDFTQVKKKTDENDMHNAALLFAGSNTNIATQKATTSTDDGLLTAYEIAQLDLSNTSLVVLSACTSGVGHIGGDGVFGMQRGFKKAGAKTIIMTLWPVADHVSMELMKLFYNRLAQGENTQAAFSNALNELKEVRFETEVMEDDTKNTSVNESGLNETPTMVTKKTVDCSDPHLWAAFVMLDGE